ncbi:MAG: hypothetical protein AAFP19_18720 [Bacteroidota bacterium]
MRLLFYTIIFLLFNLSCSEENSIQVSSVEGTHLNIESLKTYLPNQYFRETAIIYRNADDDTVRLETSSNESIVDRSHNGENYKTDNFEVTLYDLTKPEFQIKLLGTANYYDNEMEELQISKSIVSILMPFNELGTTIGSIYFENGEAQIRFGDDFRERITLHDRTFEEVYVLIGKQGNEIYEAYSALYLNQTVGVVAFRDEKNELWVFDRFEN